MSTQTPESRLPDADQIVGAVLAWFGQHARDLPWRSADCTPWGVLVSEIMLQQTQVWRVEPRWRTWMHRWPTPDDLAAAPTADVLRAWDRLGYPRRALRLQECAASIVIEHDGAVPADRDVLRTLPGIGEYTSAAVAVFAFGRRHEVLDTNVRRVLARVIDGRQNPGNSISAAERIMARDLLPSDAAAAATWSVAVMELGALVCTAKSPACPACPIQALCRWQIDGKPSNGPVRRTQARYEGSDRQARGRMMNLLRGAEVPVTEETLLAEVPHRAQAERVLASLLRDRLVAACGSGYLLPGSLAGVSTDGGQQGPNT